MSYIFLNKIAYIGFLILNLVFNILILNYRNQSLQLFYIYIGSILIALSLYHLVLIRTQNLRKWNWRIEVFISSCRIGMMLLISISGLSLIFDPIAAMMIVYDVPAFFSPVFWSFWSPILALPLLLKGVFPSPLNFICLYLIIFGFAALEYYNLRLLKRYKKELGSRLPQQTNPPA